MDNRLSVGVFKNCEQYRSRIKITIVSQSGHVEYFTKGALIKIKIINCLVLCIVCDQIRVKCR